MSEGGIYKNRYKIKDEEFTAISAMGDVELAQCMERYYVNFQTELENKKSDPKIKMLVEQRKNLKEVVEKDPLVVEAFQKLKELRHQLTSEELARIDSELLNERQPVNESIKDFRSKFYTCADIKTKRYLGK